MELLDELAQLSLAGEAEAVDRVGAHVAPLTELLRSLCECHVGRNCRVDNGLRMEAAINSAQLASVAGLTFVPSTEIMRYKFLDES